MDSKQIIFGVNTANESENHFFVDLFKCQKNIMCTLGVVCQGSQVEVILDLLYQR